VAKTKWTPDKIKIAVDTICEALAASELGLEHICNADKNVPSASTFYEWLNESAAIAEQYAHARELQGIFCTDNAGVLATQLVAKNPTHSIDPQNFRAYLDAVKWRASKLAPKNFGDKFETTVKGDVDNPIAHTFTLKIDNS
jgi:hypothetical protein